MLTQDSALKFQVTQEHIDSGVKVNCELCPVGLAVQPYKFYFNHFEVNYKAYKSPQIVSDFIKRFDVGLPVEPFEFELC